MRFILLIISLGYAYSLQAQTAFTYYNTSNSDIPDDWVRVVYGDPAGNIWVGTENGLGKLDPAGSWTVYSTANSGIPGDQILSVFVDDADVLWVGTQLNGMGKFDGTDWTVYDPGNSGIPDFQIQAITKDVNDTMWIGSQGGFTKWDGADFWYTYTPENSALKSSSILDIYIDANDIKYLGTLNGGLSTYISGEIVYYRTENSDISDNTVLQITEDADHNKWLATSFGGLSLFTPALGFLNFTPVSSDISDWTVNDAELYADGTGLLAMPVSGLDIFDNPEWQHYNNENSDLSDSLTRMCIDADAIAWIGTQARGLVKFDRALLSAGEMDNTFSVSVFPNPASQYIWIKTKSQAAEITLTDISGRILMHKKINPDNPFMDVRDLPQGNYLVKVNDPFSCSVVHLIILH